MSSLSVFASSLSSAFVVSSPSVFVSSLSSTFVVSSLSVFVSSLSSTFVVSSPSVFVSSLSSTFVVSSAGVVTSSFSAGALSSGAGIVVISVKETTLFASFHSTFKPNCSPINFTGTNVLFPTIFAAASNSTACPFTIATLLSIVKTTVLSSFFAVTTFVCAFQSTVAPKLSIIARIGTNVTPCSVKGCASNVTAVPFTVTDKSAACAETVPITNTIPNVIAAKNLFISILPPHMFSIP